MGYTESRRYGGCVVQRVLEPHPHLATLCGSGLSGVRVGVARSASTSETYRAVIKLNRGDLITDNFEHGMSGNFLGHVNTDTGRIERVVAGTGLEMEELDYHPGTGQPFRDFKVPDWDEIKRITIALGAALPGLPLIGIDVIPSNNGPVVLEINTPGDFDLLQFAARRGVLAEPSMKELFKDLIGPS